MGKLPFQIHALGSPTPVMERYLFDVLVAMTMAAKTSLPLDRPLHLFGAGHPLMFALAVALGCDLFDSAAYAKFARGGRYLTECGTIRLDNLEYFPCSCPICSKNSPRTLLTMPKMEREKTLALHNLYSSFSELRRIKQAIREGRLWELLQLRAHGHPSILKGLKRMKKYCKYIEEQSPVTKRQGLSFYGFLDLIRPEVIRHRKRLFERYSPPGESKLLILLPQTEMKTIRKSRKHKRVLQALREEFGDKLEEAHICLYAAPFGVIPEELNEVYPLSQYEITTPLDSETIDHTASQVAKYVSSTDYEEVILILGSDALNKKIAAVCKRVCSKKALPLNVTRIEKILK
jgi:7-cyano-7-deazaguanine tRNA-ribosyltransferase